MEQFLLKAECWVENSVYLPFPTAKDGNSWATSMESQRCCGEQVDNPDVGYDTNQIIKTNNFHFMIINKVHTDPMYSPLYKVHRSKTTEY